mmetsp:Transcript_19437/g.56910  ORF Transcript_19437/g.56910 Transcript_19437/m.56910 type:complete len:461 (+) Transcript_19437:95-1477(+)
MPLKKPNLRPLAMSLERQNSVQMSDTGSLALDNFVIGRNGITQSPLQLGEHDPHLRLQDLVMQRQLGRGMSSKVYLMVHRPTGKPVAVKVLQSNAEQDRESRQMVLNEVRTVFAARSDHLVAFYDAFHHEGCLHLVLEYCDMGSLEGLYETLQRPGAPRMSEPVLAALLFQLVQGLTYLHKEKRAVHRDLKPANVLLTSSGFVKLSDFGISRELDATHAMAATYCGTAAYMSPERLVDGGVYGFPSDVWSVGLIGLEGVLGRYPYPHYTSHFDLVNTVVNGPPPTARPELQQALSSELWQLLHAMMARDPAARPDVYAIARSPFMLRSMSQPVDFAAWLRAVASRAASASPPPAAAGSAAGLVIELASELRVGLQVVLVPLALLLVPVLALVRLDNLLDRVDCAARHLQAAHRGAGDRQCHRTQNPRHEPREETSDALCLCPDDGRRNQPDGAADHPLER